MSKLCKSIHPAQRVTDVLITTPKSCMHGRTLDLFELNGSTYLLVVDYVSCFNEIKKLSSIRSRSVIPALNAIFSRHGVPAILMSDNGPQYACQEMSLQSLINLSMYITSSPHFPQSNGMAKRSVKTVKSLLETSSDPYMAIISHRATPLPWCNLSLAELPMGRCLKTNIRQPRKAFTPEWLHLFGFHDKEWKKKQKSNYDKQHRVKNPNPLPYLNMAYCHNMLIHPFQLSLYLCIPLALLHSV